MEHKILFITLGNHSTITLDDNPVVLNTWYPANGNFKVNKNQANIYGEPLDLITYKAENNGVVSNNATLSISFPPIKTTPPTSMSININTQSNYEILLGNRIELNNTIDRIRIRDIDQNGSGELLLNNQSVYIGQVIMVYDLPNLKFKTYNGTGNPYAKISFQVGNIAQWSPLYDIKVIITGQAYLGTHTITENENNVSVSIPVVNGHVNGSLKYSVEFNTDSVVFLNQPIKDRSIDINENVIPTNGTFEFTDKLNNQGEITLVLDVYSKIPITDGSFNFVVTLLSINNDESVISPDNKTISFTINL